MTSGLEEIFGGPVGTCRYNPPMQDCTWPVVLESHWCGKFKRSDRAWKSIEIVCTNCRFFGDQGGRDILGYHPVAAN